MPSRLLGVPGRAAFLTNVSNVGEPSKARLERCRFGNACPESHYSEMMQANREARSPGSAATWVGGESAVPALVRSPAALSMCFGALTESDLRFRYGQESLPVRAFC